MKSLLGTTAIVEGLTGLALATMPSFVVTALLGTSLTDASGILLGRLAGGLLIALAIACGLLRQDLQGFLMVKIMAGYNIFTILLLVHAALVEKMNGFGLWPTVFLHAGLLIWCLGCLFRRVNITPVL